MVRNVRSFVFVAALVRVGSPQNRSDLATELIRFEPGPIAEGAGRYVLRGSSRPASIRPDGLEIALGKAKVRMRMTGGKPARLEPESRLPGVSHYYLGADPAHWRTSVPHYARLRAREVYPGIDVVWYGTGPRLEFDFVAAAGADPGRIHLRFEGADAVSLDASGDLRIAAAGQRVVLHKPHVYQGTAEVAAAYEVAANREVAFRIGAYDPSLPLTIDPLVSWVTLTRSGGRIATDASGATYRAGSTTLGTLSTTADAFDRQLDGNSDGFIAKFSPSGALVYATYLGGQNDDGIGGIATDPNGTVYLAGGTSSPDFPTRAGFDTSFNGASDAIVAILAPDGQLARSTFLGGPANEGAELISIRPFGPFGHRLITVAGLAWGQGFPLRSPLQSNMNGINDTFVARFDASLSALLFSTYLGGAREDRPRGIAVLEDGSTAVAGWTQSVDFPTTADAFQRAAPQSGGILGAAESFLSRIASTGDRLVFSTYLGGTRVDDSCGLAIDAAENLFVGGTTDSPDFPVLNPILPPPATFQNSLYVAKFSSRGERLAAVTYPGAACGAMTASSNGEPILVGRSTSSAFPATGSWATPRDEQEGVMVRLSASLTQVHYASYLGVGARSNPDSVAFDKDDVIVAGELNSGSNANHFVARIVPGPAPVPVTIQTTPPGVPVLVDGVRTNPPVTLLWQPGIRHRLAAADNQFVEGLWYRHLGWRPGGGGTVEVTAPTTPTTYIADFAASPCTYAVSPNRRDLGVDGGIATFFVQTQPGCWWEAEGMPLLDRSADAGPGFVSFLVNPDSRRVGATVRVRVAGREVSVSNLQPATQVPIVSPRANQTITSSSVDFAWNSSGGPSLFEIFDIQSRPVYSADVEPLASGPHFARTRVTLPDGTYMVRASGATPSFDRRLHFGTTFFHVRTTQPFNAPTVTSPTAGQVIASFVHRFEWAYPPARYELRLFDGFNPELQVATEENAIEIPLHSSSSYRFQIRACRGACGPWSPPVAFSVRLGGAPRAAPANLSAAVTGNELSASWTAASGAEFYIVQAVDPAGPATVASARTSQTSATLALPPGGADVVVAACNGDGCGPYTSPVRIESAGPPPSVPIVALPIPGTAVDGPAVLLSWNRTGAEAYRLLVEDQARTDLALDVTTGQTLWTAQLNGEGTRYAASVSGGPATAFTVKGPNPAAPTVVKPGNGSEVAAGTVQLRWTPIAGSARYQYRVVAAGEPVAQGVTSRLEAEAVLDPGAFEAFVRACATGDTCTAESDAGWGPWSAATVFRGFGQP